jgi:hypothetical protein
MELGTSKRIDELHGHARHMQRCGSASASRCYPAAMEDQRVDDYIRRLRKRGFVTDGVREYCDRCTQRAQLIFKVTSARLGGRDIRWCLACDTIRSWRRTSDDQLVEEQGFDLDKFLT